MEQQLRSFKGERRCVVFVDETIKTEEHGANRVRSDVCKWMDQGLCNAVLFSCLDAKFMTQEITTSGRAVDAVTTPPLLNLIESILFFDGSIKAEFVDGEGNSVRNREAVVKQLALASGGHPRSIEFINNYCNFLTGSVKTIEIKAVVNDAARNLCARYRDVNNWVQLFYNLLF